MFVADLDGASDTTSILDADLGMGGCGAGPREGKRRRGKSKK